MNTTHKRVSKIIADGHSHIGIDRFWKIEGKVEEYITHAKALGITDSILMSVPVPIVSIGNKKVSQVYATINEDDKDDPRLYYYHEILDVGNYPISPSPYALANELLYREIQVRQDQGIRLHYVPIVHPYFDSPEYLDLILECYNPIAVKLHGLSAVINPKDIEDSFWEVIRKYNVPLIVHTDIDRSMPYTLFKLMRNLNSPINWIRVLQEQGIRAYLAHGVKLCPYSTKIINECNDFVVGLGPDALLDTMREQLFFDEAYLDKLLSSIDADKICFDLDYPWNSLDDSTGILDWESMSRVKSAGLSVSDVDKILGENAARFFHLSTE